MVSKAALIGWLKDYYNDARFMTDVLRWNFHSSFTDVIQLSTLAPAFSFYWSGLKQVPYKVIAIGTRSSFSRRVAGTLETKATEAIKIICQNVDHSATACTWRRQCNIRQQCNAIMPLGGIVLYRLLQAHAVSKHFAYKPIYRPTHHAARHCPVIPQTAAVSLNTSRY